MSDLALPLFNMVILGSFFAAGVVERINLKKTEK